MCGHMFSWGSYSATNRTFANHGFQANLAMGLGGGALRALLDGAAIDGESVAPRASLVGQGVGPAPFKVQAAIS